MKKYLRMLGIIAVAAMVVFAMAACDLEGLEDEDDDDTIPTPGALSAPTIQLVYNAGWDQSYGAFVGKVTLRANSTNTGITLYYDWYQETGTGGSIVVPVGTNDGEDWVPAVAGKYSVTIREKYPEGGATARTRSSAGTVEVFAAPDYIDLIGDWKMTGADNNNWTADTSVGATGTTNEEAMIRWNSITTMGLFDIQGTHEIDAQPEYINFVITGAEPTTLPAITWPTGTFEHKSKFETGATALKVFYDPTDIESHGNYYEDVWAAKVAPNNFFIVALSSDKNHFIRTGQNDTYRYRVFVRYNN